MKSLSSHIKHITEIQNEDYYDSLTDKEKRGMTNQPSSFGRS